MEEMRKNKDLKLTYLFAGQLASLIGLGSQGMLAGVRGWDNRMSREER